MPTALESACDLNHNDSMTVTDEPTDLIDTSDAPEPRFVDDRLAHWAATTPDAECFSYLGRSWTYAQTDDRVRRLAGALHGLGVRRGGTVAFLDKNHPACVELSLAAGSLGAANAIINFRLAGDEIDYAVNDSGATVLLVGTELMPVIEAIRDRLTHVEHVIEVTPEGGDGDAYEQLLAGAEPMARPDEVSPEDTCLVMYSSGTTGRPKGATLSHRNILNNGYFVTNLIDLGPDDRLCIPVPFYHCFGMVMGNLGCTSHGATMVIPAPGFDPEITLRTIAAEKCTGVYGVPTMFIAMQNHPSFAEHDLSSLRTGIMAGSICPVEVMKHCVDDMHMAEVSIAYGMTETSPVSCQTRSDDDLDRRTSTIGRAHPHVEIKIVDPVTGDTVERGQPGEFCTRGYSVMLGYWEDPEKTAEAIDNDGWMHTGDLAEMREDGYCNIVGRIKDMVIRGGENVYPREIEDFLYAHPDIEDVQVIGVPDAKYGEELCAWIKLKAGAAELDASAVRAYADGKLAHYKIPRYVLLVDEFPMTVTGKIRKAEMREETAKRLDLG